VNTIRPAKNGAYVMPVKGEKPDEAVLHFNSKVESV